MARLSIALLLAASLAAACSSKPAPQPAPSAVAIGAADSDALFNYARALRKTEGCAAAAPAYRVVAAYGRGYEIAAYELADCLFDVEASGAEAALLREEAMVSLEKAAWANVARAQSRLAAELANAPGRETEALGWALVYADHADHRTFGLPALPAGLEDAMRAALGPDGEAAAAAFAASYEPVSLAPFVPPSQPKASAQRRQQEIRRRRR